MVFDGMSGRLKTEFVVAEAHRANAMSLSSVLRRAGCVVACAMMAFGYADSARAQTAQDQEQLFQRMLRNPADHENTFAFVKVATERGDYEAAVGALERLLFYNPSLTRVKYELGALYFRLASYEMARRYFREALASPDIDAITKARIETYLPQADKQLAQSRLSGFVQTGIRSQSNANFAPIGGAIQLNGTPLSLLPSAQKRSDINWFGLAGVSHDYDLQNQRGDILETRFVGYLTAQSRLSELNVGFFDVSFGPRLALAPDLLPGVTIKPYIVGGNTWLDGSSYLSSVGAGVSIKVPVNDRFSFGPDFEWRRNDFKLNGLELVSTFNSGDVYTGGLSASWKATNKIVVDGRTIVRRGDSAFAFQAFDQWGVEGAVTFEFTPPFEMITRNWSVAPFARYLSTQFDAANPSINAAVIRHDKQFTTGVLFNAPVTPVFGFSAAIQYDKTDSNIPNYALNNFSVMAGPTARF